MSMHTYACLGLLRCSVPVAHEYITYFCSGGPEPDKVIEMLKYWLGYLHPAASAGGHSG